VASYSDHVRRLERLERAEVDRAVLTAMLADHPARAATLVATDSGVRLYRDVEFTPVAMATWYIRSR